MNHAAALHLLVMEVGVCLVHDTHVIISAETLTTEYSEGLYSTERGPQYTCRLELPIHCMGCIHMHQVRMPLWACFQSTALNNQSNAAASMASARLTHFTSCSNRSNTQNCTLHMAAIQVHLSCKL